MEEKQTRRRYSKQFKFDAVELVLRSDKAVVKIAGDFDIRAELLYRRKVQSIRQNKNHRFLDVPISKILKPGGFANLDESSNQSRKNVIS